jgi:hypothetical protein
MSPRLAALFGFCGTVVFAGGVAAALFGSVSPRIEDTGALMEDSRAAIGSNAAEPTNAPKPIAIEVNRVSDTDIAIIATTEATLPDPPPVPRSETAPVQITSPNLSDSAQGNANQPLSSVEAVDECSGAEICIDQYLWSVYQRTPKLDMIKVPERIKVTVKRKGKTRTVVKTIFKLVEEDFTWKDPKAAQRTGVSLMDYVIGGMHRSFKVKLYHALHALDDAGLEPGITSGFRDDYRQSIASGKKAATDSSYHGGSRRGGYGHGLAADLVSVKGETRAQQWASSEQLWKWIDEHGKDFGLGRPYLDRDPPHVGPVDGKEYAAKRGRTNAERVALETNKRSRSAMPDHHSRTKRARTASSNAGSI